MADENKRNIKAAKKEAEDALKKLDSFPVDKKDHAFQSVRDRVVAVIAILSVIAGATGFLFIKPPQY